MDSKITLPQPISTDGPPIDVPLLRKAVEWAEAEAAKPVEQSEWFQGDLVRAGDRLGRSCGTAYCIAGFVAVQFGKFASDEDEFAWVITLPDGRRKLAQDVAGDQLGLTHDEQWGAGGLFNGGNDIAAVRTAAERIAARAGERL